MGSKTGLLEGKRPPLRDSQRVQRHKAFKPTPPKTKAPVTFK